MTTIVDTYRLLFGRSGTNKASDVDISEHGRVGGISTGQPFKFVQNIEANPTDSTKLNASLVISNVDMVQASTKTITKTIGAASYTKTLSLNAGGDVIGVSAWSEV